MEIQSHNYGINREELKNFVLNNPKLVTRKESKRYPGLFVLKYSRVVFFKNLWNQHEMLKHCRGLVVDIDFNVVQLPFEKIFNYKENDSGLDWNPQQIVGITRKVNGFMASVSVHNGQLLIGTTGSLDSDFVGYAETYLKNIDPVKLNPYASYMFEICHPEDPHIIPEKPGAYLLSIIKDGEEYYSFDSDHVAVWQESDALDNFDEVGIDIDEWNEPYHYSLFEDAIELAREATHEGYVMRNLINGERIKIKSKYYLFQKLVARKADIMALNMQRVEEEFHPLIAMLKKDEAFKVMPEQDRLEYMRKLLKSML